MDEEGRCRTMGRAYLVGMGACAGQGVGVGLCVDGSRYVCVIVCSGGQSSFSPDTLPPCGGCISTPFLPLFFLFKKSEWWWVGWDWDLGVDGIGGGVWGVGVGVVVPCSLNFLSECLQVGKWVGMAGRWVWGRLYGARGRARCGWVGGGGVGIVIVVVVCVG